MTNITTGRTEYRDDDYRETTRTNALNELELAIRELLEQHAPRARCTAPSCFSTERIAYVETGAETDDEHRPICGECRERHGMGR